MNIPTIGLLATALLFSFFACDKETIIEENGLPQDAKVYLNSHFGGIRVIQVVKDVEGLSKNFEVQLENGLELEFDKKGDIKSIDNHGTESLPDSVIPEKLLAYVRDNYPGTSILEWELDDHQQEVKLSNNLALRFSKSGDFLRID